MTAKKTANIAIIIAFALVLVAFAASLVSFAYPLPKLVDHGLRLAVYWCMGGAAVSLLVFTGAMAWRPNNSTYDMD